MVLLACALPACGRLSFDAIEADAAVPADGGACDLAAPFGAPVMITALESSGIDVTFRPTADELSGVFWSDRDGSFDIFFASRPSRDQPFQVSALPMVSSPTASDVDPAISHDGSFIVFASTRASGTFDLFEARRSGPVFEAPVEIVALSTGTGDTQPNLSRDDADLYFSSDRSGISRLYRAHRTGFATYDPPELVPVPTIPGAGDMDPTPSVDGLTFFWGSDRLGGPTGVDIITATRASTAVPFENATVLTGISSDAQEGPSWLSSDGCRLYLTSARTGLAKLYVASRPGGA